MATIQRRNLKGFGVRSRLEGKAAASASRGCVRGVQLTLQVETPTGRESFATVASAGLTAAEAKSLGERLISAARFAARCGAEGPTQGPGWHTTNCSLKFGHDGEHHFEVEVL
jgi:hypothetical protein